MSYGKEALYSVRRPGQETVSKAAPHSLSPARIIGYAPIDAVGKASPRYQGKLLHLGVGRQHIYKDITVLIADTAATVIQTNTGEILGEYNLDATKDYQAKKKHPDPKTEV